jgi:predicted nucleic acid-binding protein
MQNPRVFLDANCIYKLYLRSLLFTLANNGLIQLCWSQDVIDEAAEGLARRFPKQRLELARKLQKYFLYFDDGEVHGFEYLVGTLGCNDPNDEHVLAAATHSKCDYLVTFNLKDFQFASKDLKSPIVISPDDFLVKLASSQDTDFESSVIAWLSRFSNPPLDSQLAAEVMASAECSQFAEWLKGQSDHIDARLGLFSGEE